MRDVVDELKAAIEAFNFQPGTMIYDAHAEIVSLRNKIAAQAAAPAEALPSQTSGAEAVRRS